MKNIIAVLTATINTLIVGVTSWYGERHLATGLSTMGHFWAMAGWIVAVTIVSLSYITNVAKYLREANRTVTLDGRRFRIGR